MRKLIVTASVAILTIASAGSASAANPHTTSPTGQPSQECLSDTAPSEPGLAAFASGSAFNESPGGAGDVYAGNGAPSLNGNQDKAISQYDVACFEVSQP